MMFYNFKYDVRKKDGSSFDTVDRVNFLWPLRNPSVYIADLAINDNNMVMRSNVPMTSEHYAMLVDNDFVVSVLEGVVEDVKRSAEELVENIRAYAISQIDLWRKVPHLALEADGRIGQSGRLSTAYRSGVWPLEAGEFPLFVDCASGKIVRKKSYDFVVAEDNIVGKLGFHVGELDASMVVACLESLAKKPYFLGYDPVEQDAWRESKRREFNVQEVFVR